MSASALLQLRMTTCNSFGEFYQGLNENDMLEFTQFRT
uniref:Uncharacterized protein n=1 Tax=Arundo donax TaxID=35708 RepID=A0A0A9HTT1_ARUDO